MASFTVIGQKGAFKMLIKIDNRDLPYTIDSYWMFNGDGAHESELEYLATEYPELEKDYPKLEVGFNWSHPDIVKDLAGSSLAIIEHEMHREKWLISAPIIKETRSPQFYNYTTDWYVAEWDIDRDELDKAVPEWWQEQAKERGWTEDDFADEESVVVMKLSATMLVQTTPFSKRTLPPTTVFFTLKSDKLSPRTAVSGFALPAASVTLTPSWRRYGVIALSPFMKISVT